MTPRGLFLDLDGTLADSLEPLKQVYHDFLAYHGAQGSEAEFEAMNGPPLSRVLDLLKQRHALPGSAEDLMARYVQMIGDAHVSSPPSPFAEPLLDAAAAGRWRVAVVTSATRETAEAWLRRNNLRSKISIVVGGDEVPRGKPSPDPYLLAIQRAGSDPAHSIAVEDSRSGAAAAVAAGLPTWALAAADNRSGWPLGTKFVGSLSDVIGMISC